MKRDFHERYVVNYIAGNYKREPLVECQKSFLFCFFFRSYLSFVLVFYAIRSTFLGLFYFIIIFTNYIYG